MITDKQRERIAKQTGIPVEAICPSCGLIMEKKIDNVGFEDQPVYETTFTCLNCK